MRDQSFATTSERISVPHHDLYVEYFDRPRFWEELAYQFYTLIDTHRAWLVMMVEQGIIPHDDAVEVLLALRDVRAAGPETVTYHPGHHDVYTHLEAFLKQRARPEAVAHLSLARTRPEPTFRMFFRGCVLDCLEEMLNLRAALVNTAEEHRDAVMPGYTHQQHAQPTTYGAYLLAIQDPLERATQWMEMAYRTTNESTMGCGALAGTGFPIDRYRVAELLGFDGIMESAIASVSTGDHVVQATSAASDAMITISRMCVDMEQWANTEHRFIETAAEFSDVSSMMPQKKNPCVFEVARGKAARALGNTVGVYFGLNKALYADVLDLELTYAPGMEVLDTTRATMKFLAGVIPTMQVHRDRMLEAARTGFSTCSELADEIFRQTALPHRLAHSIVANTVTRALESNMVATDVTLAFVDDVARDLLGRPTGLTEDQVQRAMDPIAFVESHDVPGGPAPQEVSRMAAMRRERLAAERERQSDRRTRLQVAAGALDQATEDLIAATRK